MYMNISNYSKIYKLSKYALSVFKDIKIVHLVNKYNK